MAAAWRGNQFFRFLWPLRGFQCRSEGWSPCSLLPRSYQHSISCRNSETGKALLQLKTEGVGNSVIWFALRSQAWPRACLSTWAKPIPAGTWHVGFLRGLHSYQGWNTPQRLASSDPGPLLGRVFGAVLLAW